MATCQSQHFPLFSACCRAQSTTIEISYKAAKPRAWKSLFCSFLNSRSKSSRKKEEKTSARRQMLMSCDVESWKIILFRSHVEGSSDDTPSTERDEIGKKKNAREGKKTVWKENWKNKKIFDKSASLFVRHEAEAICPDFFLFSFKRRRIYSTLNGKSLIQRMPATYKCANWLFGIEFRWECRFPIEIVA